MKILAITIAEYFNSTDSQHNLKLEPDLKNIHKALTEDVKITTKYLNHKHTKSWTYLIEDKCYLKLHCPANKQIIVLQILPILVSKVLMQ